MVATYDKKGKHPRLHPRPMLVARLDEDCSMTFITRVRAEADVDHSEDAAVIAQSRARQISMLGTVEFSRDRAHLARVWSLPFNLWFPLGKDAPNVGLMLFRPRDAELWDLSGRNGLRFLFDAAKALITQKPPGVSHDLHEKLRLSRA